MTNPEVDWFFNKTSKWQEAYAALRSLVLENELTEVLKWGCPCYKNKKSNILLIHGFKDYCAVLFMQGALLKDPMNRLVQQTKNVQSARQLRFKSVDDILQNRSAIDAYIKEAIQNDNAGLRVEMKKTAQFEMAEEFKSVLKEMPDVEIAFGELTPGRQRAYLLYFSSAKQSKTRMERVEKYIPKILDRKGLDD